MGRQADFARVTIAVVIVAAVVAVVNGDITSTPVHYGDCVCATTDVNARTSGSLSASTVATLSKGKCASIYAGIVTMDGYKWYEVTYNGQRVWVVGKYLTKGTSSSACPNGVVSTSSCPANLQRLACTLKAKADSGIVSLASRHPSSETDNAYAYNNVRDMCNGRQASRSSYACSTCTSGAPGGSVCLTEKLLNYVITLANKGKVIVNELAGACHSCNSRHYRGQAVDLHNDARTKEYLDTCVQMGGWAQDEGNHVHCQFND